MASQLIQEMKMQQFQSTINGLESDFLGDINLFLGDLNYRLNTTYSDLNNINVKHQAIGMVETHDQLTIARAEGNFPGYEEAKINFFPSYKMKNDKLEYVNKKNQAPSYCDRVLYRNHSGLPIQEDFYNCLQDVYGSDHRPVALSITVQGFFSPGQYCDVDRLLDFENPQLGYGEIDIMMIDIKDLDYTKVKQLLSTKVEFKPMPLQLRVSFYDCALDTVSTPTIYSQEIKANITE